MSHVSSNFYKFLLLCCIYYGAIWTEFLVPLPLSKLFTYNLSVSTLACKSLWMVMCFFVQRYTDWNSSLVQQRIIPNASTMIATTVSGMFHNLFNSLASSRYLSVFFYFLFLLILLWWESKIYSMTCFFSLLSIIRSSLLDLIR